MKPWKWKNTDGYSCTKDDKRSTWWKSIYRFRLCPYVPLTLVDADGNEWQPDRYFFTDMGSIPRFPPILQGLVPKDRFLAFYLHDSAYCFGGLYCNGVFRKLTRKQADDILFYGCRFDPIPGNLVVCSLIWQQVRLWGAGGWCKGDKRDGETERD